MHQDSHKRDYDVAYKLLFGCSDVMADLLKGYLAHDWHRELDLTRMEQVPGDLSSDTGDDRRMSDCIWRVPWRSSGGDEPSDDWLYVYVLMEFQSRVDRTMPVRMMVYLGLLYQRLLAMKLVTVEALPPVLPVVLYNGEQRWQAPVDISEMVPRMPAALAPFVPRVRYLFVDEGRMATSDQLAERNLAAAIFRLEQDVSPEAAQAMVARLDEWLDEDDQANVRRAFCVYLVKAYGLADHLPAGRPVDTIPLSEVRYMLGERYQQWLATEGIKQVAEQGEARGEARGDARGEAKGRLALVFEQLDAGDINVATAHSILLRLRANGTVPVQMADDALHRLPDA